MSRQTDEVGAAEESVLIKEEDGELVETDEFCSSSSQFTTNDGGVDSTFSSVPAQSFFFESNSHKKPKASKKKRMRKKHESLMGFDPDAPSHYIQFPNGDDRYSYAKWLIDCMAVGDMERFRTILTDICVPDVLFKYYYDGSQNPFGPNKLELRGIPAIHSFFSGVLHSAPDLVISQRGEMVGVRDDVTDEACVSFSLVVSMTKIGLVVRDPERGSDMSSAALAAHIAPSPTSSSSSVAAISAAVEDSSQIDEQGDDTATDSVSIQKTKIQKLHTAATPNTANSGISGSSSGGNSDSVGATALPLQMSSPVPGMVFNTWESKKKQIMKAQAQLAQVNAEAALEAASRAATFSVQPLTAQHTPNTTSYLQGEFIFSTNPQHKVVSLFHKFSVKFQKTATTASTGEDATNN